MKRTTLVLEDAVMEGVREVAHRRRVQLSQLVNQWLADALVAERKQRRDPPRLPAYAMGQARVNLADRDALESIMDPRA